MSNLSSSVYLSGMGEEFMQERIKREEAKIMQMVWESIGKIVRAIDCCKADRLLFAIAQKI
ncbi:hypothetical protein [Microcoleus sp. PH2017_30_WIL_O_A]|uniref:hypothetical protein n=1 Tax=Microcoleus sp. PH2017_30_WIL_O_A TaxID=2798840 RepID=UPI001D56EDC6|nr:hypothetical protein [Microcoleus sp. PH2017_30_WIL_O_A]MCC3582655.1 hypothetical protein [Microcoleus sp. PH2017_30_WIL_O_A]